MRAGREHPPRLLGRKKAQEAQKQTSDFLRVLCLFAANIPGPKFDRGCAARRFIRL
jgi:hypothetical protein